LTTSLTTSLFAADPGLVSLAVPNSTVMAGINVTQVMLSPLGQYLLADALQDASLKKLLDRAGFDPRRDIREILFSSMGLAGANPGIVLARGTFDVPKILEAEQADGESVETYKGVQVIMEPQHNAMAFPDSTLAITGGANEVRAAIDRMSAPASLNPAMAALVNELSAAEDAWFVTKEAPGTGAAAGPLAILQNVRQLSGGVRLGAIAVVSLQAVSKTDQEAAALAGTLQSFAGTGDLFLKDAFAPAGSLLKSLNVTAEGQITKASLSVPESQIEQMMQASHTQEPHPPIGADPRAVTRPPDRAAEPPPYSALPQRIRVGSNVQKAKLLQHVDPVYPRLATQARISGVVRLNAVIGKDGTVQNLTLLSGHPLLVAPAMEAVKRWVYEPTLLNGQAVEVATQIEVEFALNQ
jgi:TonB family protein